MVLKEKIAKTLPAFQYRNFRLFWSGQLISLIGTWMQTVALGWLVLSISNSAFYVGLLGTLTFLPVLIFSLFAGIMADRVDKRRLIILTQTSALFQALILAVLLSVGHIAIWSIMVLAVLLGTINAFDAPARQSFVSEMVPREHVVSAVALNSAIFNSARTIGPAVAGFLISLVGEAACFYINAGSFIAVIAGLLLMRDSELYHAPVHDHAAPIAELKEGFRYVRGERRALGMLALLAVSSIFGFPALVLLPVFARNVLHVGPKGLGFLFAAAGIGSLVGALRLATTKRAGKQGRRILLTSSLFALAIMGFSSSHNFYLSLVLVAVAGFGIISSMALTNSTLQTLAPPHLRGRVMSIYVFVMMGMMPPGNFLAGTAAHYLGAPRAVLLAGVACLALLGATVARYPGVLRIDVQAEGAPVIPPI